MVTSGRRLAVLLAVVVLVGTLGACAGSRSESGPSSGPASGRAPEAVSEAVSEAARSAGSPTPAGDADADNDAVRVGRLAGTARDLTPADLERLPRLEQARLLASCAELSWGSLYCLGLGFRDDRPDYEALLAAAPEGDAGDLPFPSWLGQRVAMPLDERLAEQAAEVDGAILGLDKARSIAGGRPG